MRLIVRQRIGNNPLTLLSSGTGRKGKDGVANVPCKDFLDGG